MPHLVVQPLAKPLTGSVPVPADELIAARVLLAAALSRGACKLRGFPQTANAGALRHALAELGIPSTLDEQHTLNIAGRGLDGFSPPPHQLALANASDALALLCGALAASPFPVELSGRANPSEFLELASHLKARGADLAWEPLHSSGASEQNVEVQVKINGLSPGTRLPASEARLLHYSEGVKGALLFSGLFGAGPVLISEGIVSADHTERLFDALGLRVEAQGSMLRLHPPKAPLAIRDFSSELVGDISLAAPLLAVAQWFEGSAVDTRRVGLNASRVGFLQVLRLFRGNMGITPKGSELGEPYGDISSRSSAFALHAVHLSGELLLRTRRELGACALLAARAQGISQIGDDEVPVASALSRQIVRTLQAFGVNAENTSNALRVEGRPQGRWASAELDAQADPDSAILGVLLALNGTGPSRISGTDGLASRFPRFVGTLRALGAQIEVLS